MSKYEPLWQYLKSQPQTDICLTFTEIEAVLGFPLDHSFLIYKKELPAYGLKYVKLSQKEKWVKFTTITEGESNE